MADLHAHLWPAMLTCVSAGGTRTWIHCMWISMYGTPPMSKYIHLRWVYMDWVLHLMVCGQCYDTTSGGMSGGPYVCWRRLG